MSLEFERRSYGSISIIGCTGLIVVGGSLGKLEEAFQRDLNETDRIVVDLSGVDRIDSTGMGLLVRFLSRARNKGGDLRLSSPTGFVRKLLSATKLDTVFLVYTSEWNAIASFFVRSAPGDDRQEPTATVLFLDQSDDLCAFARSVLRKHKYEVLTTNGLHDAQLLAQAVQPNVILVGAQVVELGSEAIVPTLRAAAPNASIVTLPADLGKSHPDYAAAALLKAVRLGDPAEA